MSPRTHGWFPRHATPEMRDRARRDYEQDELARLDEIRAEIRAEMRRVLAERGRTPSQ